MRAAGGNSIAVWFEAAVRTVTGQLSRRPLARRLPLTDGGNCGSQTSRSTATRRLRTKTCASIMRPSAPQVFSDDAQSPFRGHGRDFDERGSGRRSWCVVIINETMGADATGPEAMPSGGRINKKLTKDWLEIVGIAKDVKYRSLREAPQPIFFYLPLLQDYRFET